MSTFEKPADTVTLTAPGSGATTDQGYLIGDLFGVATGGGVLPGATIVPAGEPFEAQVTGQLRLIKTAGETHAEGDVVWWNDTLKEASNLTGDMAVGVAVAPALSADPTTSVRLNAIANPAAVAAASRFVSTEQTGTGAAQNIAHGLGVIPSAVFVSPTDLTPATLGDYKVVEGSHDVTNVIVTVTTGKLFKVLAWR